MGVSTADGDMGEIAEVRSRERVMPIYLILRQVGMLCYAETKVMHNFPDLATSIEAYKRATI